MGRQLEAHHRISDTSPHELTGPVPLWETEQASAPQATGERPANGRVDHGGRSGRQNGRVASRILNTLTEISTASALDPTLQALLAIFGGALLAALAGLAGAAVEGKREHKRWLRERRHEAFIRAYTLIKGFDLNTSKQNKVAARLLSANKIDESAAADLAKLQAEADALFGTVAAELAPILVLGPASVAQQAIDMQLAYEADDKQAQQRAEASFILAAQQALAVPRHQRPRRTRL